MPLNKSITYHAPPPPPVCFKKFSPTYMLRSDYRVEAVILCHVCQAMKPPPPFLAAPLPPPPRPSPAPPPPPPPPPALKMVREWEGVGVWPVATAPPWWRPLPFMAFRTLHDVLCEGKVVCIRLQLGYRPPINSTKHICRHGLFPSAQLIMWVLFLTRVKFHVLLFTWNVLQ